MSVHEPHAASPPRFYAVVPAAGRSRRMGRPKLLLPWHGHSVLDRVLDTWAQCDLAALVVVAHPEDQAVQALVERHERAQLVVPSAPPPQMRDSVQAGLSWIASHCQPRPEDAWLMAPADSPRLSASVIERLMQAHQPQSPQVLVPEYGGRRGHPLLMPWCWQHQVAELPEELGINALLARLPERRIPVQDDGVLEDLDTPQDYRRLQGRSPDDP